MSEGTAGKGRLLGDPSERDRMARYLRVNHAGEYGAVRIYEGQLAVLNRKPVAPIIRQMADKEREHLSAFNALLPSHRVRPTVLQPFWHVAGFALGAVTALMGSRAAMACTVAVEEVIDHHYRSQIERLDDDQADLRSVFEQFRRDEVEHGQTALDHDAEAAPAYRPLTEAIKAGSRLAIWLSERL